MRCNVAIPTAKWRVKSILDAAICGKRLLTDNEIVTNMGAIEPVKIAAILGLQPSPEALEEAVVSAAGASDATGDLRRPLIGTSA